MEELEFSLVKKKIIKTNDVMKILAEKNYNLNRLVDKLKILYSKYRDKSNEAFTLRSTLETCKIELESLKIDYNNLLSKSSALEEEHNQFVNKSEIKYQKVCQDLNDVKKLSSVMSNTPKHCTTCKSYADKNTVLSKEVKLLNAQLSNLKNEQVAQRANILDSNSLTENHMKELKNVKIQLENELQKIESRYIHELDVLRGKLIQLGTREAALYEEINMLKDHFNAQVQKADLHVMETEYPQSSPTSDSPAHLDNLQCSSDYEVEDELVNKYILELKYMPKLLSPIDGDKMLLMNRVTEQGEMVLESTSVSDDFSIGTQDEVITKDIIVSYSDNDQEKASTVIAAENNMAVENDIHSIESYVAVTADNKIQARLLARKVHKEKLVRCRRFRQNLLKTLFKYIDNKLAHTTPYRLRVQHKRNNQNMSLSYRNKRKIQMMRWKYLREVCFSSTDSEYDSRIVRSNQRPRRKKNKRLESEDMFKLIQEVKEDYGNLTNGFDELSKYYTSLLNTQTTNKQRSHSSTLLDIDENIPVDSPDSGYSGKSDTDIANFLTEERTNSDNSATAKAAINHDYNSDDDRCILNDASQCTKVDNNSLKLEEKIQETMTIRKNSVCNASISDNDNCVQEVKINDNSFDRTITDVGINQENTNKIQNLIMESGNTNHLSQDNTTKDMLTDCGNSAGLEVNFSAIRKPCVKTKRQQLLLNSVNDNDVKSICEQTDISVEKNTELQVNVSSANNSLTHLLQESVIKDVSYQLPSKRRISHYNNKKIVEIEDQKLLVTCISKSNNSENISIQTEIDTSTKQQSKTKQERKVKMDTAKPTYPEIIQRLPNPSNAMLLKKYITFPDESTIYDNVVAILRTQDLCSIIRCILTEASLDINSKPNTVFTPPAPVLTEAQRALLALLTKLQKTYFPHILEEFMSMSEQFILQECNLQSIQPVTRLYLAVCKLTRNLDRMRRMTCDVLYFLGDLSVPFLFTVLSTWIEVLPFEEESQDNPLVKVIIQVINLKTCTNPGYNLLPLKNLLKGYYGYPTERWNSDNIFKEIFSKFLVTPTKVLEYCLLILCRNHPGKWTNTQINVHIQPILQSDVINITLKNMIQSLMSNIITCLEDKIPGSCSVNAT